VTPDVPDLVEVISYGVEVDWTTLTIGVRAEANGARAQSVDAVEQLARRQIEAAIQQAVPAIRVTREAVVADLLADPDLGPAVRGRISRWEVDEAIYGTSGRVELHAVLSLQDLLKPWTLQIARAGAAPPPEVTPLGGPAPGGAALGELRPTGLVVDARGTELEPVYALRLVAPDGQVLYAGELFEEQAVTVAPYRFVTDPAHPAAAGAGDRPVVVRAISARGADVGLDAIGALQVLEAGEALLGRGDVVVVVDGR
jgi:hypothetical protein